MTEETVSAFLIRAINHYCFLIGSGSPVEREIAQTDLGILIFENRQKIRDALEIDEKSRIALTP